MFSRDAEPRRRKKDYDRDRDRDRDRERDLDGNSARSNAQERPRSSRSTRNATSKNNNREAPDRRELSPSSSSSSSLPYTPRKSSVRMRETDRRASAGLLERSKPNIPYPTFSKAHSRESVGAAENSPKRSSGPYTPDTTDLGQGYERSRSPNVLRGKAGASEVPPSPPLTTVEPNIRRTGSGGNIHSAKIRPRSAVETGTKGFEKLDSPGGGPRFSASRTSLREAEEGRSTSKISPGSTDARSGGTKNNEGAGRRSTGKKSPLSNSPIRRTEARAGSGLKPSPVVVESATDSDATSVGPDQVRKRRPPTLVPPNIDSPPSDGGSTPTTPNAHVSNFHDQKHSEQYPMIEVFASVGSESDFGRAQDLSQPGPSPMHPPPPPPPALEPADIPRVDYLLQNGGLNHVLPRTFSAATHPAPLQRYPQHISPRLPATNLPTVPAVFAPIQNLFDDLEMVISKNGSVAVATGYRSAARRMLDKLESVFARNISSEFCSCIMCQTNAQRTESTLEDTGVSWGEILELVSGRKELPSWPPFSLPTSTIGLGITDPEHIAPMQKLDIDVPEEYREHYLRQSKKTKHAVQNWLASQPEDHASPPSEVDDETLTFAMLTYLEPEQRRTFTALSRGLSAIPTSRAPTPAQTEPKSDLLSRMSLALQRLYRLPKRPRDPESCMYLLKNPFLHSALATLAAISAAEWDILLSGRLDGFLWSGAEQEQSALPEGLQPPSRDPSRGPVSHANTPFGPGGFSLPRGHTPSATGLPTRGATPALSGTTTSGSLNAASATSPGPVQMDEETEIAVLAEVEREIYLGMEALEDAFEALHTKAETVRTALLKRSRGLQSSAMARRREIGAEEDVGVRAGTPASIVGGAPWGGGGGVGSGRVNSATPGWSTDGGDDWMGDDVVSLAPDDSASNVGWKEKERRQKERQGRGLKRLRRRTPDVVREEG